jgi:uncharacterized protein YgbK (DUF1537 family)
MPKLLIIADDLTGALDTGIQFSKIGVDTVVSINPGELVSDTDVIVADTESRHLLPETAYERVRRVLYVTGEVGYIYKKTDSTLRGNTGAEFKAIIDETSHPVIFIPAFPEMGRTTKNGIQYINGVPLGESPFASDPVNPVRKSYIPDIIKEQADLDCVVVTREEYGEIKFKKGVVYIIDGETRDDLELIGEILKDKGLIKITAGCAGFARTLANLIYPEKRDRSTHLGIKARPLILVCGSINEVSLRQVEYAKRNYQALDIVLSLEDIINGTIDLPDINGEEIILIRTTDKHLDINSYKDLPVIIQERLGEVTSRFLQLTKSNTLVVFGGDTLLGITEKLGISHLYPLIEIEDGVVLSEASSFFFITKAGGFGKEDIIDRIISFIRGHLPEV